MSAASAVIKQAIALGDYCASAYLADLSDADILVRPIEGANHIAWQLGHLIGSENMMLNNVCPDSMPELPAGFAEKHTTETSQSDNPSDFLTKDEYLKISAEQRAATLAILEGLSDEDLAKPTPEAMQEYAPTVGDAICMQGSHWLMHSGQWVIVRRKLGHKAIF